MGNSGVDDNDLGSMRKQISKIDEKLLRLFNDRASLARKAAFVKLEDGRPVTDLAREKEILTKVKSANRGPLPPESVERILRQIIDETREFEEECVRQEKKCHSPGED